MTGDSQATLSWSPPANNGGSGIIMYKIYRSTASGEESFLANCGSNCTWIDTNLVNGQTYYYQISAVNAVGEGFHCDEVYIVPARSPTNPTTLRATGGLLNITVIWNAPTDMGGGITGYDLYRGTTDDVLDMDLLVNLGNVTSYVDTVAKGATWYYRVVAHNWAGYSGYSNSWQATSYTDPAPVNGLAATAYVGYVHLTWSSPSPGDPPMLGFRIYRSTISGEETPLVEKLILPTAGPMGMGYSYDDTNVINGTLYYYKITQFNIVYESPLSGEVSATPIGVPFAPVMTGATGSVGAATVAWMTPADGGSEITGYVLYWGTDPDELTSSAYLGVINTYTVEGLADNATYYFAVAAENVEGEGALSNVSTATTFAVPGMPEFTSCTRGDSVVHLAWNAPSNGGSAILGYTLYRSEDIGSIMIFKNLGPVTSYDDTEVVNGTQYYYWIAANNDVGDGPLSEPASATPLGLPSAPDNLVVSVIDGGSVQLSWNAPAWNNFEMVRYVIYRSTVPGEEVLVGDTTELDYTDGDLVLNTTYCYKVRALNAVGPGPLSGEVSNTTIGVPSAPVITGVVSGDGFVNLTWSASTFDGHRAIEGYYVRYGTNPEFFESTYLASMDLYYNATGLANGTTYFFAVYATNGIYESEDSVTVSAVPKTLPSAPAIINSSTGVRTICLNWTAPYDGGDALTGYDLYYGMTEADYTDVVHLGVVNSYTLTGLADSTKYYFAVCAKNGVGDGPLSGERNGTTYAPPTAPVAFIASDDGCLNVSWTTPDSSAAIDGYYLYRGAISGELALYQTLGAVNFYNDTDVSNGQAYFYQVRAFSAAGDGALSSEVIAIPARAPTQPLDLITDGGIEVIYLNWSAPADMGGGVLNYTVYRGPTTGEMEPIVMIGNVTSYIDSDVIVGVTYYYGIVASNWAGTGPASEIASESTIYPPSPPTFLTATAHVDYVHLTWAVPSPGNSPLLGFRIYRSTTSGEETLLIEILMPPTHGPMGMGYSYDETNVVNGTLYYYKVTAFNRGYESDLSSEVSARPYNVPTEPTEVVITGGLRNVTVSWSAPASDNGAAVTGYVVFLCNATGGEVQTINAGLVYSYTFEGLRNGTQYFTVVRAVNAAGNGEGAVANATTFAAPGAPVADQSSGDGWINITWASPASDSPVLGYYLYRGTTSGVLTLFQTLGPVVYFNDTEAVNGQTYYCQVQAFSAAGDGNLSNEVSAIPSRAPDAPTGLEAVRGDGQVSLSWTAPEHDGGSAIIGYAIYVGTTSGTEVYYATAAETSCVVDGLTNGQTYYFQVAAVNVRGNGTMSPEISAVPATVPGAPTYLGATAGTDEVELNWTAPSDGGAPITGYIVYRLSTGMEIAITTTGTSLVDDTVVRGHTYSYRVVAVNAVGPGPSSNSTGNMVPAAVPGQPTGLEAVAAVGTVTLSWSTPADDGGLPVIAYNVYRGTSLGTMVKLATTASLAYVDENGTAGTSYVYGVSVVNAKGGGEVASVTSASLWPPPAPTDSAGRSRGKQRRAHLDHA